MIKVKLQKVLQAKKWRVLRFIVSRVQDFPKFMPNVKSCEVIQRGLRTAITSWFVEVDGMAFRWKEREELDLANFIIRFKALEGDLASFEGAWILRDHPSGGTEVTVEVNAKLGIPKYEELLHDFLAAKIEKNFELMLQAINEQLVISRYRSVTDRKTSDIKGFAVIGHPYNHQHLIRYFQFQNPDFKMPSEEFLRAMFEVTPSHALEKINIISKTGKEVQGYFIVCPIIPDHLMTHPEQVIKKVIQACKVAEDLGLGIVTLGGFTSIAGERFGDLLLSSVHVPVTTGNTFTVAMVIEGIKRAARLMAKDLGNCKVTVIGGNGDIGGACARILAAEVAELTITSRTNEHLPAAQKLLSSIGKAVIKTSCDNNEAVREADIVIAAASSTTAIVEFSSFKPGAIVCDVGYPKNLSYSKCDREDILIFSGGIASIPSSFEIDFDLGLPSKDVLYGCFSEAIILSLEEKFERFSWGKGNITPESVTYIRDLGKKHGFVPAPFFWGHKLILDEQVAAIGKVKVNR